MAVHFKFRSAVAYDSINLDDLYISVRNLKQRIVEHKNLASNRTIDFDLVITDSQTGEEYRDENHLVPRNTSVIIKRVPAAKSRSFLPSVEQPKVLPKLNVPPPAPPRLPSVTKSEVEGDDFGVDLFAAPTPAPAPPVKSDEDAKIMEMVSKSTLEWQRFDNAFVPRAGKGRGRGLGGGPPAGYVCHRCGQPGHFIQQCPTNGDPNYDIKKVRLPVGIPRTRLRIDQEGSYVLPDGSVAAMQPDENLFAKEADALMAVKQTAEVPPELRCPLCRSTFKEAVMIPCCHYSFCDKCIRQNLMMKGQCPQCGSLRFKNDDLLPNIALRQAIDKFLESQVTTSAADQNVAVPDGDSASHQMNAPTESRHSADDNADAGKLRDASSGVVIAENSVASKTDANLHPVIPKDASGSVNLEGNEPVRDNGDGGNTSEPFVHKGADDIALESEVSKGKKKKKRARAGNAGDGGGTDAAAPVKQGERFCFQCGSPSHLAKDCVENVSYPPHPGMFPPGGPFPMAPYGPDMFWHGPPVSFAPGYGDGMYGPGLGGPMAPAGAYQMLPPYAGVPPMHWFGDHPGMMSGEMPVSRKEFLKLQEEEHNRRAMNDHRGDWSHSKSSHGRSSDTRDRNGNMDRHGHKSDADYNSRSYSDKYREHSNDRHQSDKYPSDKYQSDRDKYSSDKYKQRASEESSRRKSDRDSLERDRSDSHRREKEVSRSAEKQRSSSAAEHDRRHSEAPKEGRHSEAPKEGRHSEAPKEERRSKFSSRPSEGVDEKEKRSEGEYGSKSSRGYDREGEQDSDDGGKRKKRREKSREEEGYSASKYSSSDGHSSRKHNSEAAAASEDHHARWRPDEDRYWDDRKHSSSSSRHHHRR